MPNNVQQLLLVGNRPDLEVSGQPALQLPIQMVDRALPDGGHVCTDGLERAGKVPLIAREGRFD